MSETTPRQERRLRRQAENRETILHAAEAVLIRRGFSKSTMDDIAREADFSKATVYKYFPAKSELVLSILIHFLEDIERILDDILAARPEPSEALRRMLRAVLEFHAKKENISRVILLDSSMSKVMRLFMAEGMRPESGAEREFLGLLKAARLRIHDKAGGIIVAGIRSGIFRSVRIPDVTAYIDAVIEGFGHQKYWMEPRLSPAETADLIHGFLLRGIGAPSKRAGKE